MLVFLYCGASVYSAHGYSSSLENEDCDVTVASSIFAIDARYLCGVTAGDMSMPLNMA